MSAARALRRLLVAGLLTAALVAAVSVPAGALANPTQWGTTFCTETVTWLEGALQGSQSIQAQTSDPSATPADAKAALTQFLDTGVDATKSFGSALKQAGAPDIANGAKIQAAILAGIAGSGVKLAALDKVAKALPTKPPKVFAAAANRLGKQLSTFTQPFQKGLSKANSLDKGNQLGSTLQPLPACAPLVNGTIGSGGTTTTTG